MVMKTEIKVQSIRFLDVVNFMTHDVVISQFTNCKVIDLFTSKDFICISFEVLHNQKNLDLYYKIRNDFKCDIVNNTLFFIDYETKRNYKLIYKV